MSYLEDWVRENQGLGRDEVTRKMLGAGYQRSEIDAAWRRRGRLADASNTSTGSATRVARALPTRPEWLKNREGRWAVLGAVTLALAAAVFLLDFDPRVAIVIGWLLWRFGVRQPKPTEPPPTPPAQR